MSTVWNWLNSLTGRITLAAALMASILAMIALVVSLSLLSWLYVPGATVGGANLGLKALNLILESPAEDHDKLLLALSGRSHTLRIEDAHPNDPIDNEAIGPYRTNQAAYKRASELDITYQLRHRLINVPLPPSPTADPAERARRAIEWRVKRSETIASLMVRPIDSPHKADVYIHSLTVPELEGKWLNVYSSVVRPIPSTIFKIWLAVLGVVIAGVGLAFLFGRLLTKSIRSLDNNLRSFGRGKEFEPLPVEGPTDVQALIKSFNTMGEQVDLHRKSQSALIQSLSHDVRGPMANATHLLMQVEDEDLRDKILTYIEKSLDVTQAITHLAEQTTIVGDIVPVDLYSLLEVVVDDQNQLGNEADLTGDFEPIVESRILALERVFANLIDNAIKYGEVAHVRLLQGAGGQTEVWVEDKGPGIPKDSIDFAMSPFARLDKNKPGTGLGLAIARSVLTEMGGTLRLENLSPKGMRAVVTLPG